MPEIDLTNPAQIEALFLKEAKKRANKALKSFGVDIADYLVDSMKREIESGDFETMGGTKVKGALNTGELLRSVGRKIKGNTIIIGVGAAHAKDVEYGLSAAEAKFKVKYPAILQWVRDKKISRGTKAKWAARKILQFIHENGINHRPYFRRGLATTEANKATILRQNAKKYKRILTGET